MTKRATHRPKTALISLNEVDDHFFPNDLPIFSGGVVLVFSPDDTFPQVLNAGAI